jgi:hypothetical protein
VTMDEAIEAGLLVDAFRRMPQLILDCEQEATGEIAKGHTRWKILALEIWAKDHEDDSSQQHVGEEIRLPPTFVGPMLAMVATMIAGRLTQLGVEVE